MNNIIKLFFCGLACSLLFPPYFILPLGFIVFPYLYFFLINKKIQELSYVKLFTYGFSFGFGLNLIILFWIREPFLLNLNTKNYSLLGVLLIFYVSIYFGLIFVFLNFFKNNFAKLLMIPVAFVLAEVIRENFVYGFPWTSFAALLSSNHYFIQLFYYLGTYGTSFFLLCLFLIPVVIFNIRQFKYKKISIFYLTFTLIILFILVLLIFIRLNFLEKNNNNEIKFSLNQFNIHQSIKSNSSFYEKRLNQIIQTIENGKDTIHIFSENEFPYIIEEDRIVSFFQEKLKNNNSVIIGGIRKNKNKFYNSLYFITKNDFQYFDKKILVPFGEFIPFRKYFKFLEYIAGNIDFEKGNQERIIDSNTNDFNFIPVICYEIIFFNNLLSDLNHKIPFIINITNDAWFGNQSGPYQHFYLSRIRSVEFNKFLIRVSNNGVSAIFDNYGRILNYIPLNEKNIINQKIVLPNELNNYFYIHKLIYLIFFLKILLALFFNYKNEKT